MKQFPLSRQTGDQPPDLNQTQPGHRLYMGQSCYILSVMLWHLCTAISYGYEPTTIAKRFESARHGIVHVGEHDATSTSSQAIRPINWLGTAFTIDQFCTFVTAKHVIRNKDKTKLVVRFQLPSNLSQIRTESVRVLWESTSRDLAFLKIDMVDGQPCHSRDLHVFSIHRKETHRTNGQEVMIIGYPVIGEQQPDIPIVRSGIVASSELTWPNGPMLLLDLQGVPGFSGSPVILVETGEVIGVVLGPGPTQRTSGFEWATPLLPSDYEEATKSPDSPSGNSASK